MQSEAGGLSATRIIAVTPVHNRRNLTIQCLRSLFASDLTGVELRVVVVDDGSSDGTAEALSAEFGETVTVNHGDGSLYYTGGMNRGIATALALGADYVLGFNDDSVFPLDCIQHLLACAKRHPGSIVGPLLLDWNQPETIFQIAPEFSIAHGGWRHWTHQRIDTVPEAPFMVDSIAGNCMLIPVGALEQNRWMQTRRLKHYGDTELTVRLRRCGWTLIIEPAARLLCQPNTPPPSLRRMPAGILLRHLFISEATPHNLRQRFWHTYLTAPSGAAGILAFSVFVFRLSSRAIGIQRGWPVSNEERSLRSRHPRRPPAAPADRASGRPVIWYIWPYREFGGVQVYLLHQAAVAKRFGFETRALIPASSHQHTLEMLEEHGIATCHFPGTADVTPYRSLWKRVRRRLHNSRANRLLVASLADLIRRDPRPAVLHADLACWTDRRQLQALLSIRPTICTMYTPLPRVRGPRRLQWRRNLRTFLANPRFVLTSQTVTTKRSLAPYVSSDALDSVRVASGILDGAEIDRLMKSAISRTELEQILELPPCDVRLGVLGQLIPRKGYLVLLEALELLAAKRVDAHVLWICAEADVTDSEVVRQRASDRFHIRQGKALEGGLRGALPAIWSATDLFVLPSLEEGFPLALAEAMAMGMPCISTRVGGIPETVCDGRTGLLIAPGNAEELAAAVERLTNDHALRERLGRAARAKALEVFERDSAAIPTIEAYRRLAEART